MTALPGTSSTSSKNFLRPIDFEHGRFAVIHSSLTTPRKGAAREVGFKIPVVVRLEGTNVDKAREILKAAKAELPTLIPATDLTDAAKKVVSAVAA